MFSLITATRRYIQEGWFQIQYNEAAPLKKAQVFLFSDAMLFASTASLSSKLKPKRFILIGTTATIVSAAGWGLSSLTSPTAIVPADELIEVVDVQDEASHIFEIGTILGRHTPAQDCPHQLIILISRTHSTVDHNPKVPVATRVFAESKEQKSQWLQAIAALHSNDEGAEAKPLKIMRPTISVPLHNQARGRRDRSLLGWPLMPSLFLPDPAVPGAPAQASGREGEVQAEDPDVHERIRPHQAKVHDAQRVAFLLGWCSSDSAPTSSRERRHSAAHHCGWGQPQATGRLPFPSSTAPASALRSRVAPARYPPRLPSAAVCRDVVTYTITSVRVHGGDEHLHERTQQQAGQSASQQHVTTTTTTTDENLSDGGGKRVLINSMDPHNVCTHRHQAQTVAFDVAHLL